MGSSVSIEWPPAIGMPALAQTDSPPSMMRWMAARTLAVLNAETLDPALLARTISVVLKYDKDVSTALGKVRALQDPNRRAGRGGPHDHGPGGHDHTRGEHDHGHGEPPARPAGPTVRPAADRTEEGVALRAAKDRPGRHGNFYGGRSAFDQR